MDKLLVFILLVIVVSTIALNLTYKEKKNFTKRKAQSRALLQKNIISENLAKITQEKVKVSKRLSVEKMAIQAGYDMKYEEYLLICILSSLVVAAIFNFVMSNTYLAILGLGFGWVLPQQFLVVKRNKRIEKINEQVGPCLKMFIERYKVSKDMRKAIEGTAPEFDGEPPIDKELKRLVLEIQLGKDLLEAMKEFAMRIGNPYMQRFVDYYQICTEVGTLEVREMLNQALLQYQEDRKNKLLLKKEISSVKSQAYLVLVGVPFVAIYQSIMDPGYINFMTKTQVGQVGTAVITTITLVSFWFINKKIGAPIE